MGESRLEAIATDLEKSQALFANVNPTFNLSKESDGVYLLKVSYQKKSDGSITSIRNVQSTLRKHCEQINELHRNESEFSALGIQEGRDMKTMLRGKFKYDYEYIDTSSIRFTSNNWNKTLRIFFEHFLGNKVINIEEFKSILNLFHTNKVISDIVGQELLQHFIAALARDAKEKKEVNRFLFLQTKFTTELSDITYLVSMKRI
jgi:hypothetical protein